VGGIIVNRMPNDPFSQEEREALGRLIDEHAWLGRDLFKKPLLARRELGRLRSLTHVPVFVTPELPHDSVVDSLSKVLETAAPLPLASSEASR
jgi:hypothetical protein